jgi:metal-responsive CopG/Arc/MetJ family transcriptional regulator
MKTISLKISGSLEQRLQRCAAEAGLNKSELLRQALEQYLSTGKSTDSESVTALAGDLVGCFRGPVDLSTSPDYFDDYGR